MAFKNTGYRIPVDDEKFIKQPDVPLGAPGWKKLWPKNVWPGAIPDRVPLLVGVEMVTDINPSDPVKPNFAFPEEVELLAGGTLGDRLSFFSDLAFEFGDGTKVGLERGHCNMQLTPGESQARPYGDRRRAFLALLIPAHRRRFHRQRVPLP